MPSKKLLNPILSVDMVATKDNWTKTASLDCDDADDIRLAVADFLKTLTLSECKHVYISIAPASDKEEQ